MIWIVLVLSWDEVGGDHHRHRIGREWLNGLGCRYRCHGIGGNSDENHLDPSPRYYMESGEVN